jgi:hypothetical protein
VIVDAGMVVLLRAVVPPRPEISAGINDAGNPAASAAGTTLAGIVIVSLFLSVIA